MKKQQQSALTNADPVSLWSSRRRISKKRDPISARFQDSNISAAFSDFGVMLSQTDHFHDHHTRKGRVEAHDIYSRHCQWWSSLSFHQRKYNRLCKNTHKHKLRVPCILITRDGKNIPTDPARNQDRFLQPAAKAFHQNPLSGFTDTVSNIA